METPAPPATQAPPGGAMAWGVGLLALVPFPFIAPILAGVLMAALGRSQRRDGRIAAANGRSAGNWGLTYALMSLVLFVAHFLLLFFLTRGAPSRDFFPVGTALTVWAAITLVHVVLCIRGIVRARKRQVLTVPSLNLLRT